MKKNIDKYPWIKFELNLKHLPYNVWFDLGQCVSKCRHIRRIPLLPEVRKELHRIYLCKGVMATTAIEGNTLSEEQVKQILDGTLKLEESKRYLQQEVENILTACRDIAKQLGKDHSYNLSTDLLCSYNQKVLAGGVPCSDGAIPGQLRKDRRGVGSYRAPEPADVPELLNQFCEWFNQLSWPESSLDKMAFGILKAVTAHLYIEWIHPFGDGNGRTGRLVEFAILLSCGIPSPAAHLLSNHYNSTRVEYYRQLQQASQNGGDITEFFRYAIGGLKDGLLEVIDYLVSQTVAISWEHYVYEYFRNQPGNPRMRRMRNMLLAITRNSQGSLKRQEIEQLAARIYLDSGKKINTLTRDLNELCKMELIIQEKDDTFRPAVEEILGRRLPFSV